MERLNLYAIVRKTRLTMKTIKSIEWRAEIKALRDFKKRIIVDIEEHIESLMKWIEDEENEKRSSQENE